MNKPAKITGYIAAALQTGTFLIIIIIFALQDVVVSISNYGMTQGSKFVIPFMSILGALIYVLLFGIYCIVISTRRNHKGKEKVIGIVFTVLYGLCRLVFAYSTMLENTLYSRLFGSFELAKLSIIHQWIYMINTPIDIVVAILICISFGCVFMQSQIEQNTDFRQ